MSELNLPVIDKTIHKTRLWLDDCMTVLETTDRTRAFRALRAVLHALRDNVAVETAANFTAQMPLLVRGLYYEGYTPGTARDSTVGDFLGRVAGEFGDFPTVDLEQTCRRIFRVLAAYLSSGEMREMTAALPADIADFLTAEHYRSYCQPVCPAP